MSKIKGTEKALSVWEQIPHSNRLMLLNNAYCGQCKKATSIANGEVTISGGDFVIKGECITCRTAVARYVEI
jgi:hypothetical protein